MYKIRRLKPRLMLPVSDPILIDTKIPYNKETLVVVETTSKSLSASRTA
jgi:hypothetical protein